MKELVLIGLFIVGLISYVGYSIPAMSAEWKAEYERMAGNKDGE